MFKLRDADLLHKKSLSSTTVARNGVTFYQSMIQEIQETPLIFTGSNIDYLRSGNVKSLTLRDQEES